jgi:cyclophilin family peptidyl-prolyl cis-trans isomerase
MRRLALLLLLAALAGCGGGEDAADTEPAAAGAPNPDCRAVDQPEAREPGTFEAPTTILDADAEVSARVVTSCGEFTISLAPESAPNAVSSFIELAERDYFDGTFFHRIVPGFVIQGGDPTGTGTGGPGYTTVDTPAQSTTYTRGVVAMAKTAAEAAGTAGSQFFVVTGDEIGLPPDYAVIGEVTEGLDTVELIGELGDPSTELPTQPVVIDDVVITGP